MPNPGQPTISPGATGGAVRRLQRALRRTPNLGLTVDGQFNPQTETAVKGFQDGEGLVVDGIVGPLTWNALPDGGPMPVLQEGSSGDVVRSLQTLLTNGAPGAWGTTPLGVDGAFGPHTKASVEAFQTWGGIPADGIYTLFLTPGGWAALVLPLFQEGTRSGRRPLPSFGETSVQRNHATRSNRGHESSRARRPFPFGSSLP